MKNEKLLGRLLVNLPARDVSSSRGLGIALLKKIRAEAVF